MRSDERKVAVGLLAHLENSGLFSDNEEWGLDIASVCKIQEILDDTLTSRDNQGSIGCHIRVIAAALRRFSEVISVEDLSNHHGVCSQYHDLSCELQAALNQFRGVVGVHVAVIAARFELKLPLLLRATVPLKPEGYDLPEGPYPWFDGPR